MRTQIRKIGNSLGSIIPSQVIKQLKLTEGSEIEVLMENDQIVIRPVEQPKKRIYKEEDLLQGLTAYNAHADELPTLSDTEIGE